MTERRRRVLPRLVSVRRIMVGGVSGSGKTTFAKRLAAQLSLPYHEMDAFYHGPNWEPIPTFEADVQAVIDQDEWVIDSDGYAQVRDAMWSRVDTVVWLDLRRPIILARVVWRSAERAITKRPMFNGNIERASDWFDAEHPIQWSMRNYNFRKQAWRPASPTPPMRTSSKYDSAARVPPSWWLEHLRGK